MDASQTTITVGDSSGFRVGDYVSIDVEILKILGPGVAGAQPTSTTWQVARAQKLTQATTAGDSALLTSLVEVPLHFVFQPGYTLAHPTGNLADGPYYNLAFRPGRLRILYASLQFAGLGGLSDLVELSFDIYGAFEPFVSGTLPGLRSSDGGYGLIEVFGGLEASAQAANPLIIPDSATLGVVYAAVERAPVGQDIQFQLKRDGANFGPIATIPAGDPEEASGTGVFFSGATTGNVGGSEFTVQILQVGSDPVEPGHDLRIYFRF